MDVTWGEVPYHCEAERKLTKAIRDRLDGRLHALFADNRDRLPPRSELITGGFGSWRGLPMDLGDAVIDIVSGFIKEEMPRIIPALGFQD